MVIITGAFGFIGSVLIGFLNGEGVENIICVDNLGNEDKWKNISGKKIQDIICPDQLFDFITRNKKDIEIIIHMGACASTTEQDMDFLLKNNYQYSQAVYNACLLHEIRLIYASSASSYGNGVNGFCDDNLDLMPLNKYGYVKHIFDVWVKAQPPLKQCVGLKFFNVYGPNEYHKNEMRSVIYNFYKDIAANGNVNIYGADGSQSRDFVYILDVVKVIYFFMQNQSKNGLYNVGSGNATDFNMLSEEIFNVLHVAKNISYTPYPDNLEAIYQKYTKADIGKLRNAGYNETFTTICEGIKDYVKNYLVNGLYY